MIIILWICLEESCTYLVRSICRFGMNAIFMHNPVSFLSPRSSSSVEHQSLLHPHQLRRVAVIYLLVFPGRLPVSGVGGPVRSNSRRILPVAEAEEIPLFLPHLRLPWLITSSYPLIIQHIYMHELQKTRVFRKNMFLLNILKQEPTNFVQICKYRVFLDGFIYFSNFGLGLKKKAWFSI